ncbi:hypothetical protein LOZ36_005475, partial [Ophidiomyces ophidiicola]
VLPNLQAETKEALEATLNELEQMGRPRVTGAECRTYLTQVGQDYSEVCKAAISGNYEGTFFLETIGASIIRSVPVRRLRAVVQLMNQDFLNTLRQKGHKFHFPQFEGNKPIRNQHSDLDLGPPSEEEIDGDVVDPRSPPDNKRLPFQNLSQGIARPVKLSPTRATAWVRSHIIRSRGRELPGNFNPLVIGELFWEQSSRWHKIAETHTEQVGEICNQFLSDLLRDTTPKDVYTRLWSRVQDELALRSRNALAELRRLCEDLQNYPINYNHYYTDTITKRSNERERKELKSHLATHTTVKKMPGCQSDHTFESVNVDAALNGYFQNIDPDMDSHGCDAVLDCLFAIYKVNQKVFMANVTIQVIERHIVRDLDQILSAVVIAGLPDDEVQNLSSEPPSARKQREFLIDRREKLEEGRKVLRQVMRTPVAR